MGLLHRIRSSTGLAAMSQIGGSQCVHEQSKLGLYRNVGGGVCELHTPALVAEINLVLAS
jgi:hypothetical protein